MSVRDGLREMSRSPIIGRICVDEERRCDVDGGEKVRASVIKWKLQLWPSR